MENYVKSDLEFWLGPSTLSEYLSVSYILALSKQGEGMEVGAGQRTCFKMQIILSRVFH